MLSPWFPVCTGNLIEYGRMHMLLLCDMCFYAQRDMQQQHPQSKSQCTAAREDSTAAHATLGYH